MPLSSFVVDTLGVVTICLVAVLVLLGLFCIACSFYFRSITRGHIQSQGLGQLGYFSGPWIIRITFILFAIWWGLGEIIRLNLLRREGRALTALSLEWQETVCKCYVVSNLGFAEPCLFLTLVFLLRASLQNAGAGTLSRKWNGKTAVYVFLCCLPVFLFQLMVILAGHRFSKSGSFMHKLPHYFTRAASTKNHADVALCTYPLLSTLFLGLFAIVLTAYVFWLGRRILHLIINKCLQKRVYTLIFSVCGLFPMRVILLGLSVLSWPEHFVFELLTFLAFLSLLCCVGVGICMLVYYPVADSLALRNLQDIEARRIRDEQNDTVSLLANQSRNQESNSCSPEGDSASSAKRGSISFRALERNEGPGTFVELSLFSPSQHSTPPGSSRLLGWPLLSPTQGHGS